MTVSRRTRSSDSQPIDAPGRRRLPILLRHAWYGLNQAFRRRIAHLGITPDQFTVMRTLLESGGITQSELTEQMSSDPNTVASLLERMEKSGLLERRAHEKDRRAHRLDLQADGKRKYQKAREVAIALQTEVLRPRRVAGGSAGRIPGTLGASGRCLPGSGGPVPEKEAPLNQRLGQPFPDCSRLLSCRFCRCCVHLPVASIRKN